MKRGFTLTEMLAVIVIIGLLVIIMFPAYLDSSNRIKNSNLVNIQNIVSKSMLDYANKYFIDEIKPSSNQCRGNDCNIYFSINYIKAKGIFQTANGDIINPVTNADLEGYVRISYNPAKYILESTFFPDLSTCTAGRYAEVINGVEEITRCN